MDRNTILAGDAWELAKSLPDKSINCIVTSPPYYGLRDYGEPGQFGLEATPEEYVGKLVALFRELRRVLRHDGVVFLNLGDSYANDGKWGGSTGGKHAGGLHGDSGIGRGKVHTGLKPKDLIGIPWRVAFALQADGWYLRSEIIWAKPNPMPESVTDRPTKAHEQVFLLTKSPRYFYDAEAIREPVKPESLDRVRRSWNTNRMNVGNGLARGEVTETAMDEMGKRFCDPAGRNKRTVWTLGPETYSGAHFAVMPTKLVEPCILAGCPHKVCSECGAPWVRVVERTRYEPEIVANGVRNVDQSRGDKTRKLSGSEYNKQVSSTTTGFAPTCACNGDTRPGVVLDPFAGSGTVGAVAKRLGRDWIGFELNPAYIDLAWARIGAVQPPLFAGE